MTKGKPWKNWKISEIQYQKDKIKLRGVLQFFLIIYVYDALSRSWIWEQGRNLKVIQSYSFILVLRKHIWRLNDLLDFQNWAEAGVWMS